MQRRPDIDVSVGGVFRNFDPYTHRLSSRSSMTTKFPIHTSGVGFLTFNFITLTLKRLLNPI